MFNQEQIQQLAELIIDSGIDTESQEEVAEYLGLLLEDIAGCECLSDSELEDIQLKIKSALNRVCSSNLVHHIIAESK